MLTPEKVKEALERAEKQLAEHPDVVPAPLYAGAKVALASLKDRSDDIAALGEFGAVRALSWWSAFSPFSDPPARPANRSEGIAAIQAATDSLIERRDAERLALERLKRVVVEVGLGAVRAVVPLLVAAL